MAERLRSVTELLSLVALDPSMLGVLTEKERIALVNAAGDVFEPDVELRRQRGRARQRRERAEKLRRDEHVLAETGIRRLREKPVFTTPNVFPPEDFVQTDVTDEPRLPRGATRSTATSASRTSPRSTTSTTSSARRARHSTTPSAPRPPTCAGRVALLTGGRVKIGYQAGHQAAARRGRAHRHHALPPRLRAALRAGARLRRVGRPARDLRARPAAHAERRGVLPSHPRRRATGSTSSSTTRARPCAGRPTSTAT